MKTINSNIYLHEDIEGDFEAWKQSQFTKPN